MENITSFAVFHIKATDMFRVVVHYKSGKAREYVARFWEDVPTTIRAARDSDKFNLVNEKHAGAVDGYWYKRIA